METGLTIFLSYLLGSIPFSYIIVRLKKGIDLRKHGTKNVGATNVSLVTGKKAGFFALILDIAKGVIPVIIAQKLLKVPQYALVLTGMAAIIGHNWSIFLKFSGGRGVSTTIGVLGALVPWETMCLLIPWGIFLWITHSVLFSMSAASIFLPFVVWGFKESPLMIISITLIVIFIQIRGLPTTKEEIASLRARRQSKIPK